MARAATTAWLGRCAAGARGHQRRRRRGLAAHLPACARLHLQAGELLGIATVRLARCAPSSSKSTTPLASAIATCSTRRVMARNCRPSRCFMCRPLHAGRFLPLPFHAHQERGRRKNHCPYRLRRRVGPLLQTSVAGTLVALTAASLRKALWGYPAMTLGVVARIHWQALKLWRKRVPFVSKPQPPEIFVTR